MQGSQETEASTDEVQNTREYKEKILTYTILCVCMLQIIKNNKFQRDIMYKYSWKIVP
jgi:hypothetical protein